MEPCGAVAAVAGVTVTNIGAWDLAAVRPRLQQLWSERRLVVGAVGLNPMRQRMDFVEALVSLAQNSPYLVPEDCKGHDAPDCGVLLTNGLRPAASVKELRAALDSVFGEKFLRKHAFDPARNESEQRSHVQALLAMLKRSYAFYRQGCLAGVGGGAGACDAAAPSQLLGQIACRPTDDGVAERCVYAELRHCEGVACSDDKASQFFEYARFHGPLALIGTRFSRDWVMGQCEEFSRVGYALLTSLGYEARYVLDFTDHVWIEVKLPSVDGGGAAWLHADPSEGVLDSPLMYERDWGKRLSMIFALTPWSIEHVTARYTRAYEDTIVRRGISEETLQSALVEANERLAYELPRQDWGHASHWSSTERSLEDLALWSHFEAAR
mmetsp:Transcript_107182/g.218706  ORF Transcript_107182/g.218706 Transcript_107182/m.218706 type:complete len:382 (-) Transcript_107182:108-1253(-)